VVSVTLWRYQNGQLVPGRVSVSLAEFEQEFVTATGPRRDIFDDFEAALAALRGIVPRVPAVWIAGGFASKKATPPTDIDVTWVLDEDDVNSALSDPTRVRQISVFHQGPFIKNFGLQLDTYVLPWRVNPENGPRDAGDEQYLGQRGKWDDFWQRQRSGFIPHVRADALPLRGYVEVVLDGFA
jgi:predicted nucleotidyltransferase